MRPDETCPTCGTKLGPLHERERLRRCDACQRPNPRGFRYCGFCAAPLESAAEQAERVEVAAPPGGWPNLSQELVELRFFLDRGELDEAYELLSILQRRHPGHPALVDFNRGPATPKPRPDTQVYQVVDAVLADSPALSSSSLPRRAVPQWNAPVVDDGEEGKKTRAHATVPLGADDEEPTSRRPKPVGSKKAAPARVKTDKHLGAVPLAKGEAAARRGKSGARPQHTVAVSTLQPPRPFQGEPTAEADEEARPTKIMAADEGLRARRSKKVAAVPASTEPTKPEKLAGRKRAPEPAATAKPAANAKPAATAKPLEPKKRSAKHAAVQPPAEPERDKKRARPVGARFGQGVLGRLGKSKG